MPRWLPPALAATLAAGLLLLFHHYAPLQPASVAAWAGIAAAGAGVLSLLVPLRFIGIRTRRGGALCLLAGIALCAVALLWPARTVRIAQPVSVLDRVLPRYDFHERHTMRVHAAPDAVAAAWNQATFGDLRVFNILMRARWLASGRLIRGPSPLDGKRILEVMRRPQSGFYPLHEDGREVVFAMAGRPWAGARPAAVPGPAAFDAFHAPQAVKIAFNLRVEDAGAGWSLLTTETRVLATDDAGRRRMAPYWRLIYPGTGMIRRMWLNSVRDHAEAASAKPPAG